MSAAAAAAGGRAAPAAAGGRAARRLEALMPGGVPRYVRCYDAPECYDRYTVVFTRVTLGGSASHHPYLAMSGAPYHPQGLCQHGESVGGCVDTGRGWAPAMGRKCHLGRRIPFRDLPGDCRDAVVRDYRAYWGL